MKKLLLTLIISLVCSTSHAQVSTGLLTCIPSKTGAPKFSVQFFGSTARLTLKLNTFTIPYIGARVDKYADRWSIYENNEIRISTTIPNDGYVSVGSGDENNFAVISGAFCK